MKIALQFSRSCARGHVPEVLTIAIIIYHRRRVHARVPATTINHQSISHQASSLMISSVPVYLMFHQVQLFLHL